MEAIKETELATAEETVVEKTETAEDVEIKKANEDFDAKMKDEPEETVADEESGDDEDKIGEEGNAAEKEAKAKAEADAKAEAEAKKAADEKIPAEVDEEEDKALLDRAGKAGLTEAQVKSFSSKEDLEAAVGILESRHPEKEAEKKVVEDKPYDCGLDPDVYDKGLIEAVNKMGNDFKAELKALKDENAALKTNVDTFSERDKQKAAAEHTDWFDEQLAGLDGFDDVFGKGTYEDVNKGSNEFKNRKALDQEMWTIAAGYEATGRKVPVKAELFKMALNMKFPEKIKGAVVAEAGKKLSKRASQNLGRGSGKEAPTTSIEKANQVNKDFDKKLLD